MENKKLQMDYITLHTKHTTYQMGITESGFLLHLYYGPKAQGELDGLLTFADRGYSGNPYELRDDRSFSLDALPQEYPNYGNGDFRSPAFRLRDEAGIFGTDLRYESHRMVPGKYGIPGLPAAYTVEDFPQNSSTPCSAKDCSPSPACSTKDYPPSPACSTKDCPLSPACSTKDYPPSTACSAKDCPPLASAPILYHRDKYTSAYTVEVTLCDQRTGVKVALLFGVFPELDVITRCAVVKNEGNGAVFLNKAYSMCLDFLTGSYDLIHFHGRHAMERNFERIPVICGTQSFGSRRGTSSHQHNPFFFFADRETTEDYGSCYGISLLYSGNFRFEAEHDQYRQTRVQIGISDEMFDYELKPGEEFYTPEAALAYTGNGLAALSHIYHKLIRQHVCRGFWKERRRPILINNWEATYYNFTGKQILSIAREAANLGVEMFVLDDGWFGKRDDDNSGLGDWYVNEEKLGKSLAEISEEIHGMDMLFGLWIEPEMVNEDSSLYKKHPDWAFVIPGKKPVMCRNQLVLDFSRKEVVDGIFQEIAKVLDSIRVEYIKMDMNRSICDVYSAVLGYQNYGKIMHHYVLGVYDFLERLHTRYPGILIEGCSGGGGRFDAGMLYYTPQIWCSDDTDAIERIKIQHGTSFGYPISAVGSHVSAVPNEQTGRSVPLGTRAVCAMAGSFGYELDISKLDAEEKEYIKQQILDYKKFWNLLHNGLYYRLHQPAKDTEAAAWMFVSEDKNEALLNIISLDAHANAPTVYVRLKGLDARKNYLVRNNGKVFNGNVLMHVGIAVPFHAGEYHAWQYHLQAL